MRYDLCGPAVQPGLSLLQSVRGGLVKCWGKNNDGQLGNDSTDDSAVPVAVKGLSTPASEIRLARSQSCASLSGGEFKCWGKSDNRRNDRAARSNIARVATSDSVVGSSR